MAEEISTAGIIIGVRPEAEEAILAEASTKNRLVVTVGALFQDPETQQAWVKCMEMGWIRLFDVGMILTDRTKPPGPDNVPGICRVFRITNIGEDRLREIRRRRELDNRLKGTKS